MVFVQSLYSFIFVETFYMSFISKLKSAFGQSKNTKTSKINDSIEAIISDISDHEPLAYSDENVLYAGLNELGGYYFFQTVVVGTFKIKTKKGAQLKIDGHDFKLELRSDSVEFESDPTDVKGRWITKIDFQIEEKDAKKLDRHQINEVVLTCKKNEIVFSTKGNN